jgi:hypothetical protein
MVKRLERALRRTPNLGLAFDGVFGPQLEAAVEEFHQGLSNTIPQAEEARIRLAVKFIPPDNRDIWIRVGMTLRSTGWGFSARMTDVEAPNNSCRFRLNGSSEKLPPLARFSC